MFRFLQKKMSIQHCAAVCQAQTAVELDYPLYIVATRSAWQYKKNKFNYLSWSQNNRSHFGLWSKIKQRTGLLSKPKQIGFRWNG